MTLRLIAITCLATALFAQAPGGPRTHGMFAQGKTTAVQSYLNLTDAQIASLQQLRQAQRAALKPIFEQIGPLRESLHAQQSSGADATTVGKLVLNIQTLEQQATPIRASFRQQAQAVLTPDQRTKLAALESAAALIPAIHQAGGLNLLEPPAGSEGGPHAMAHGRFGH